AAVGSAALFAAYHLSAFQLLPTFLLGAGLAAGVLALGSLWPAIVAHGVFNLVGVLVFALGGAPGQGA
nr:CPBP family intramembrane metalloprotease [Gemmatimonadota bacterium]NIR80836.1 CPBP family intramembrane metalloprotease [Gemmatimonadota bacterium]NIT85470.1 CPBP family intramembrane metalloprotease [Gemmatimonadota bacterium]NIU29294.1 CPBP family intramembrane metalloprotease [Gemmatimonadota bacterium]NIU34371.1 CPBP family intramembrane metalloprotease [Gemmatimonadota bacterium]